MCKTQLRVCTHAPCIFLLSWEDITEHLISFMGSWLVLIFLATFYAHKPFFLRNKNHHCWVLMLWFIYFFFLPWGSKGDNSQQIKEQWGCTRWSLEVLFNPKYSVILRLFPERHQSPSCCLDNLSREVCSLLTPHFSFLLSFLSCKIFPDNSFYLAWQTNASGTFLTWATCLMEF